MKILVSAYACEPDSGSEPFLGWRWAVEIAKHHEVVVLTRDNNRIAIEKYIEQKGAIPNLRFQYIGLPKALTFWKKGRRGMKLYYTMWQRKAVKEAIRLNAVERFDLVHHVTFGAFTQPTYMYRLGIPFVWGPLGGGEKMPKITGRTMDFKSRVYEFVRNMQISISPFLPYAQRAMKAASCILVTTEETKDCFPKKYHDKVKIMQSLGIDQDFMSGISAEKKGDKIRILMVGRMIGWKGFDFGIEVFKRLHEKYENVELYLRGKGELKNSLKERCGELLGNGIYFSEDFLDYKDMYTFYTKHDIFLNATLHDSGCLALLEAMSAGLPIICVDVGGPKVLTDDAYAIKVPTGEYETMIENMVLALSRLIEDKQLRIRMGALARKKVDEEFLYEIKYKKLGHIYETAIKTQE